MPEQSIRRFPPPWTVEQMPGGYKVKDANGSVACLRLWARKQGPCRYSQRAHHGRGEAHRQQHCEAADFSSSAKPRLTERGFSYTVMDRRGCDEGRGLEEPRQFPNVTSWAQFQSCIGVACGDEHEAAETAEHRRA